MSLHALADTPYAYNLQIIKEWGKQSNALDNPYWYSQQIHHYPEHF